MTEPFDEFRQVDPTRRRVLGFAAGLAVASAGVRSWAAGSDRPVTIVAPYPAGGVIDAIARALTEALSQALQQPVVVINKPGANANIAADAVAHAEPDGQTLLLTSSFITANPLLETGLRWQGDNFVPIAHVARASDCLVVPETSAYRDVRAYVDAARTMSQRPFHYGMAGRGTPQWLAVELLRRAAGLRLEAVQYQGGTAILNDLVGARITMAVLPAVTALPHVQAGKFRALAVMGDKRMPEVPEVPTIAEAGFPEATGYSWYGLHAPSGTPPSVVSRLGDAVARAVSDRGTRDRMASAAVEPLYLSPGRFALFLREDHAQWRRALQGASTS